MVPKHLPGQNWECWHTSRACDFVPHRTQELTLGEVNSDRCLVKVQPWTLIPTGDLGAYRRSQSSHASVVGGGGKLGWHRASSGGFFVLSPIIISRDPVPALLCTHKVRDVF